MTPRVVAAGLVPLVLVAGLVVFITGPGGITAGIDPLPEITIERVDFVESEVRVVVRNTGSIPVDIVQGDINDRIQPSAVEPDGHLERFETAILRIPYAWNEAEPYAIGVTVHDGTRFERVVEAAAPAVPADLEQAGLLALAGTYMGVIPVFIGLAWLPFIRRLSQKRISFFLALTAGLLLFIGVDSAEEALEVSAENLAGSMNGALLALVSAGCAFLALQYVSGRLVSTAGSGSAMGAALMVSVGIGLHNFGEGLALGAAISLGSAVFSTYLLAGFAMHNTTEGIAIASPLAGQGRVARRLAALGVIAGFPAVLGAWAGGFAYSPISSVVFLAVGSGAAFQVAVTVARWVARGPGGLASPYVCGGLAAGLVIMYVTSIVL
ncbi:MAG: divalent cation transporter [Thaumarchaeota archaeon]|nr:divalent cation transporter [Nitrososphaerota archaeon]